jgi:hypothetical protein
VNKQDFLSKLDAAINSENWSEVKLLKAEYAASVSAQVAIDFDKLRATLQTALDNANALPELTKTYNALKGERDTFAGRVAEFGKKQGTQAGLIMGTIAKEYGDKVGNYVSIHSSHIDQDGNPVLGQLVVDIRERRKIVHDADFVRGYGFKLVQTKSDDPKVQKYLDALWKIQDDENPEIWHQKDIAKVAFSAGVTKVLRAHMKEGELALSPFSKVTEKPAKNAPIDIKPDARASEALRQAGA